MGNINQNDDANSLHALIKNISIILNMKKMTQTSNNNDGEDFTILSALGIEEKELSHCRIIYELLNKDGKHGIGTEFLKYFFEDVLKKTFEENAIVTPEKYFCEQKGVRGRIDLYIETKNSCYPIEVKIKADDQEGQIYRYYKYASERHKNDFTVFYLTLNGTPPKKKSTEGLSEEEISKNVQHLSFGDEIVTWLKRCADFAYRSQKLAIYRAIWQYIILIEKLTVQQVKKKEQERVFMGSVIDIMSLSSKYFQAAKAISESFKEVEPGKMKDFFNRIKEHVHSIGGLNGGYNDTEINNFYCGKRSYPKLKFKLKDYNGIQLMLVFEVTDDEEESFYYGVVPEFQSSDSGDKYDDGHRALVQARKHDVEAAFDDSRWKKIVNNIPEGELWVWWKFLPSKNAQLNFKMHNNDNDANYFKLYDHDDYEDVISKVFKEIDSDLRNILECGLPENYETHKISD